MLVEKRTRPLTIGEMSALVQLLTREELEAVLRLQPDDYIRTMTSEAKVEQSRREQERQQPLYALSG